MKTKSSRLITAGIAAVLATPALALEAPADNAPPPPAPEKPVNAPQPANLPEYKLPPAKTVQKEAKVESAFLGIVSGEVPSCLADHVGLKDGEGVIVRAIVPDSPAGKAGIVVNDIITAVGGEAVGSPADITNRILAHKPGESIAVSVIHKGAQSKVDVTLCVRPKEVANAAPQAMDPLGLESFPKEMADRIRRELDKHQGSMDLKLDNAGAMPRQMEEAMREMQQRMQDAMKLGGLPGVDPGNPAIPQAGGGNAGSSATFRMQDTDGSIELKSNNGSKEATIRDRDGNVVWSGPWNTETDKSAAPADVQNRMQGLGIDESYKGNGIRFGNRPAVPDN